MMNKRDYRNIGLSFILLMMGFFPLHAQERVTTLGLQIKPIIPSKFFDTGPESATNGELTVDFTPLIGYNFGMVIRKGLTKNWSFETGINLVRRRYQLNFQSEELPAPQILKFRYVGYEIPLQAVVFVRLGQQLWMNASAGFSLDMYPSDTQGLGSIRQDTMVYEYRQDTFRRRWLLMAVLANYGFEYRTRDRGYWYIGASFHRPFGDIATTMATLTINTNPSSLYYELSGSYLTFDLRYFFHEDPERRKKMKKNPAG